MTARSLAWRAYLDRLREVAQLLRADPASRYGKGHIAPVALTSEQVRLSVALSRGALVLTCSHLQGYFSSVLQEFLEQLDGSGVDVARLPKELKAELCLRFPYPDSLKDKLVIKPSFYTERTRPSGVTARRSPPALFVPAR
jgi:hypothetical protein